MAGPSPWRASRGSLALSAVVGAGFGSWLWATGGDPLAALVAGVVAIVAVSLGELQAAFRLSHLLGEFADQVPGDPETETSVWGDQTVRWPDMGLAASGWTHRYSVRGFEVEVDGGVRDAPARLPREAARAALEDLARRPAFGGDGDRLPSIYPRLSALAIGPPLVALGLVTLAIGLAFGPAVLALGGALLGGGLLAGVGRWAGLVRVRSALAALGAGLEDGGVTVAHVDLVGGVGKPAFAVVTDAGTVPVQCTAHPWGRIRVTVGELTVGRRLADARAVGREAAPLVRGASAAELAVPDRADLPTRRRLLFAGITGLFTLLGAAFLLLSVPGGGCGSDCWLLRSVGALSLCFAVGLGGVATGRLPGAERLLRQ